MPSEPSPSGRFVFGLNMPNTFNDTQGQTVTRRGFDMPGPGDGSVTRRSFTALPLPSSAEAKASALNACASAQASADACNAAIAAFVAALQRENTGADKAKKIDSAIGNLAYDLYKAVDLGNLPSTLRTILSTAIDKLAEAVTDTVQKTSIKSVATSVGQGNTVQKGSFYQNSASASTVGIQ